MADFTITPNWIERVLALPTQLEQKTELQTVNLMNERGLHQILDYADAAARNSPAQAEVITQLCQEIATKIGAANVSPRAKYLRAQTYSLRGNAQNALTLIESARNELEQLGLTVEALRTEAGRIHAYTMLGDYASAIEVGQNALVQIERALRNADDERATTLQVARGKIYVNLGPPLSESGRFEETLAAYSQAEMVFDALQLTDDLAYVMNNRGVTLRYLGRVDEALAAYQNAIAASHQTSGYFYALLQTNIGDAHLLLGDYQSSLQAYNHACREFAAQGLDADEQICKSQMADTYLALNLFPEALTLYQEAADALQNSTFHYHHGKALWGVGIAQSALDNFDEGRAVLWRAAERFAQLENIPLLASVRLEEAALLQTQGDQDAALALARQALDQLSRDENNSWPVQQVYAHLRMADLLADMQQAEGHLQQAASFLEKLPMPHLRYRLLLRQAQFCRMQKRNDEAQSLLESAVAIIEQLRTSLANEAFRISFQQDKMSVYEALIALHLEQASSSLELTRLFDLIERAKSRALVERLSGVIEEVSQELGNEVTKRTEQIQSQLNAIYNELLGQETGDTDEPETRGDRTTRLAQLNKQASKLESELTQMYLQLQADGEIHLHAQALQTKQIQQHLTAEIKLISYYLAGDEILAFIISQSKIRVVRNICCLSELRLYLEQLRLHWQQFHVQQSFIERHLPRLEQNAQQIFYQIYQLIFEPLEDVLAADSSPEGGLPQQVVIAPHGLLHQVPFHALFDGQGYLVERFEITYTPSATLYTLCQQQRLHLSKTVSVFAVSDPAIPAVAAESRSILNALPHAKVWLDDEANLAAFAMGATDTRILHLACHGLYRIDNPAYSALKLHDGWVTAISLAQMDLAGTLVVLSACESGRGAILAGDEVIGLTRACLRAGANALLVSQWLVQDDTGAMLMAEWYSRIARGQSVAAALRTAQRSLKNSHPHPYYWAPFILIGKRSKLF